ncbi:Endoplasmic reticulum zinc transporter [Mortierella sp. NVP85]|nr:Endoplasmic reticulum zinc transporter [Mortierella sp. NVP85]
MCHTAITNISSSDRPNNSRSTLTITTILETTTVMIMTMGMDTDTDMDTMELAIIIATNMDMLSMTTTMIIHTTLGLATDIAMDITTEITMDMIATFRDMITTGIITMGMITGMITTNMIMDTTITSTIQSASAPTLIGLAYIMLFDAFGVLNIFVSSVIHMDKRMQRATVKHPFGIQRFEVLFGLSNAIFLLFIGMNMLKESLEHLMLEDGHHNNDNERGTHHTVARVPLFWTWIGLGATLISALGYRNHDQFCQLLRTAPFTSNRGAYGRTNNSKLEILTRNRFTLTSLACVVGVILVAMFPRVEALDNLVAIGQSMAMFLLGGPLAKTLGMILLQTTPPGALENVEEAIRQLSATNPAILRLERAHVWTNTYGQLIGTLIVSVAIGADEQAILATIHQRFQGLLDLDTKVDGAGELTVKLVQH